jgi:hypothetical protein
MKCQETRKSPRSAEIEDKRPGVEDVGQQAVEHRDADDGVVLLEIHHVDGEGDHVGATGEGDAGDHVEADPEPPRRLLGEIGHRAEPLGEAHHQDPEAEEDDRYRDDVERREQLSLGLHLGEQKAAQCSPVETA